MADKKRNLMLKRQLRVRNRLKKHANGRPRFSIFRSSKNIYAQIIDDTKGVTLVAASSVEKTIKEGKGSKEGTGGNNVDMATKVGAEIAKRAKKYGVEQVVFDRGAYLFHGRIKALADAAREGGLQF